MHDDAAKCLSEPTDRAGTELLGRASHASAQHEVMCFSLLLDRWRICATLKSLRANAKAKMSIYCYELLSSTYIMKYSHDQLCL